MATAAVATTFMPLAVRLGGLIAQTLPTTAQAAATTKPAGPFFTMDDVLSPYIYVFYAAFIVAFLMTPIMRQVALYYGIIDQPDAIRKLHSQPVAYLGGVAVFLGWMAGLAISQFCNIHALDVDMTHLQVPLGIVSAAVMIVVLGLWDDTRGVRPEAKIFVQVLAAIVLLRSDVGIRATEPLLAPVALRIQHYFHELPSWYSLFVSLTSGLFTIGLVVGCCNATNLLDGLDGLCGGVTSVIAAGFVFLAVHMATYGETGSVNTDGIRVVLGLALLGGVLGFIPYNFNPASIFMGDTGSMFLGFSCATLIATMAENSPKWCLAALVMFALPILDTSLAFARRWVNKRPLFSADRHHIHHQLVARGFSVKQTVVISYGLAFCFALLGASLVYMRVRYAVAFYLVIFGSIIVAAYKMGMVHEKPRAVTPMPIGSEELSATVTTDLEPSTVMELKTTSTTTSTL